jgi:1-acyl-sn-glycerol-3-phosphate acyltransferase
MNSENINLIGKILYYANILCYIIFQIPVLLFGILLFPLFKTKLIDRLHNTSLFLLDKMFLQITFLNKHNYDNKNYILLCNHTSSSDGYLRYFVPNKFLCICIVKNSLFYIPFLGQVFWFLNFIFIKRDNKNSRNNTKSKITQKLNANNIVQLFPQGTREKNKLFINNEIILKKGSIEIALMTNVPILLCYHNIGDRIDDENKVINFHKKVYAIYSNTIILPNEYSELPIEEKVNKFYNIIYDEFIRLEKIVLDKI